MRPYILAEQHWEKMKDASFELAVLPWGATEAHNYHLPYASDVIEADRIAAESARIAWEKGAKVIVLPTIPYGVNTGQKDIYLDINLYPSTQLAILKDIIEVLDRQGLQKLMILNSHGGNEFRPLVRELGSIYPDMFLCIANWYQAFDRKKYFTHDGDHADEMETSLLLHFHPELVLPKEKWGKGREKLNRIEAFGEGWLWMERKWPQITEDTGVGNPEHASADKGKAYFRDLTMKIGEAIYEIARADTENLYE